MTTKPDYLDSDEFDDILEGCEGSSPCYDSYEEVRAADEDRFRIIAAQDRLKDFIRAHYIPKTGPVHEGFVAIRDGIGIYAVSAPVDQAHKRLTLASQNLASQLEILDKRPSVPVLIIELIDEPKEKPE